MSLTAYLTFFLRTGRVKVALAGPDVTAKGLRATRV